MADLKLYSASDEKLTYYVTETRITDEATGSTEETLKKYTVYPSDGGLIVGNRNGRFITMSGGTVNLNGGYITNFSKSVNTEDSRGGAIMTSRATSYAAGGKIYMTGGFVTANTSYTKEGGGISIDGYGYMSLTGGYVTNNVASGGVNNANFTDWGGGGTAPVYALAVVLLAVSASLFRFTFRRRKDRGTIV